jgi:hypothetical protein
MQLARLVRERKRRIVLALVMGVLLVGLGIYWFGPQHLLVDRRVEEGLPTGGGAASVEILSSGSFVELAHETSGTATLLELADGRIVLRFEDLQTLSGPDLRVYLSSVPAEHAEGDIGEDAIDLGGLKGNSGNQNYEVPAGLDPSAIRSAVIWCRRFTVGFGAAPLESAPAG